MNNLLTLLAHDAAIRSMVIIPLALILLDLLTGIGSAIRHHDFLLAQVGDFARKDLQKWLSVMAVFVFAVLSGTSYTVEAVALGAPMLAVTAALVASITENIAEMCGQNFAEFGALVGQLVTWLSNLGVKTTPAITPAPPPNIVSFTGTTNVTSGSDQTPYASEVTPPQDQPAA